MSKNTDFTKNRTQVAREAYQSLPFPETHQSYAESVKESTARKNKVKFHQRFHQFLGSTEVSISESPNNSREATA
jgi:hypothetical protein